MDLQSIRTTILTHGAALALLITIIQCNSIIAQVASGASVPVKQEKAATTGTAEMLIGSGDLIEVSVYGSDFDKQVRVSDSGEITLPLLGTVKVAGLSVSAAEKHVAAELARGGYFNQPQVSILEREYASQGISVLGEVQKPGIYPLPGARTLFDAISAAGGTTPKAGTTVTVTHRGHGDQAETLPLGYGADAIARTNIQILPGDTVIVSKAGIVYVVGDVRQPSGVVMEGPAMTVLQAIAMAQGTNSTASLGDAKLIRKTPHGMEEVPVSLKKILAAKAPDVPLQADDIIFVPSSTGKRVLHRSLDAIVQTATGVAIYRP